MDKLLPCPFCGGEAESKMYLWGHHAETHEPIWCYYIYCTSCDAMTDNVFKSKEEAIAAWNRRSDAVPVVRGEWILVGTNEHDYETSVEEKCSLCGRYVYRYDTQPQDNFCPNCGAKMDGERRESEVT